MKNIIKLTLAFPFLIFVFIWYWILILSIYLFLLIAENKIIADTETKKIIKFIYLATNY